MEHLYIVAFCTGALTVFFDVADQSFLPVLVHRERLVEGNSKLELSRSVAQITGPGVAGVLVQALTAPIAVALDALSFLGSTVFLLLIRVPEPAPARANRQPTSIWSDVREGLRLVFENPHLRSIAACTGTSNLFGNGLFALYVLYLTRELAIEPVILGFIMAVSGPGALLGALLAGRLARTLGLGTTIVGAIVISSVANVLVPLASGPLPLVIGMLILQGAVSGFSNPVYNINQVSLRQAITPDRLQGRMNASMRFLVWGTIPVGALLGGALGEAVGLRPALALLAIGGLLAPLWVVFSPVRRLRDQPTPVSEPAWVG
jgi:predicted MFS family arabinose efflux permease